MTPRENPFVRRLPQLWFSPPAQARRVFSPALRGLLAVLSQLYQLGWQARKLWFWVFKPRKAPTGVRVIAVGNLIVGGAGKTPCALALAKAFKEAGIACGFISRGYRSQAEHHGPTVALPGQLERTPPDSIGDESWLLAWRTGLPIAVGKNRWRCLQALLTARPGLQAVILDDGLQQRSLASDEQILVIDERQFGNGKCLPAGPLREPVGDLRRFSTRVRRGQELALQPGGWVPLGPLASGLEASGELLDIDAGVQRFCGRRILAAAGIAEPQRFFDELRGLGISFESLALADHEIRLAHLLHERWKTGQYDVVLMTEKDAVKFFNTRLDVCGHAWALRQEPRLDPTVVSRLIDGFKTT
ncbi:MAG: tetraacyldisaccharide 4'-kinase [Burkholderiaceae bacterium]|nr:tetraacyldisaccharide 4'-kinase [Burkholderiaceae bacterium]